jgi:hypothetical protein
MLELQYLSPEFQIPISSESRVTGRCIQKVAYRLVLAGLSATGFETLVYLSRIVDWVRDSGKEQAKDWGMVEVKEQVNNSGKGQVTEEENWLGMQVVKQEVKQREMKLEVWELELHSVRCLHERPRPIGDRRRFYWLNLG